MKMFSVVFYELSTGMMMARVMNQAELYTISTCGKYKVACVREIGG